MDNEQLEELKTNFPQGFHGMEIVDRCNRKWEISYEFPGFLQYEADDLQGDVTISMTPYWEGDRLPVQIERDGEYLECTISELELSKVPNIKEVLEKLEEILTEISYMDIFFDEDIIDMVGEDISYCMQIAQEKPHKSVLMEYVVGDTKSKFLINKIN